MLLGHDTHLRCRARTVRYHAAAVARGAGQAPAAPFRTPPPNEPSIVEIATIESSSASAARPADRAPQLGLGRSLREPGRLRPPVGLGPLGGRPPAHAGHASRRRRSTARPTFRLEAAGGGRSCCGSARATTSGTVAWRNTALDLRRLARVRSSAGCSWFAFLRQGYRAGHQAHGRRARAETLLPFGYAISRSTTASSGASGCRTLLAEGQREVPRRGLTASRRYIAGKGLMPGIWTNTAFRGPGMGRVARGVVRPGRRMADPRAATGSGYAMDDANPATLADAGPADLPARCGARAGSTSSWTRSGTCATRATTRYARLFRKEGRRPSDCVSGEYVAGVRRARRPGRGSCWRAGASRPELVGLVDGVPHRRPTGSPTPASPSTTRSTTSSGGTTPTTSSSSDAEAWRSTMVTSLTGSLLMLTDRPERYRTGVRRAGAPGRAGAGDRAGAVLRRRPSRSSPAGAGGRRGERTRAEAVRRGPRRRRSYLYLLDIARPFESWTSLGRTGGDDDALRVRGPRARRARGVPGVRVLGSGATYGTFSGGVRAGRRSRARFNSQVFVVRERLAHPQLVATGRHLTGGGVDLVDVAWRGARNRAAARRSPAIRTRSTCTEPAGFATGQATCDGAKAEVVRDGALARFVCRSGSIGGDVVGDDVREGVSPGMETVGGGWPRCFPSARPSASSGLPVIVRVAGESPKLSRGADGNTSDRTRGRRAQSQNRMSLI